MITLLPIQNIESFLLSGSNLLFNLPDSSILACKLRPYRRKLTLNTIYFVGIITRLRDNSMPDFVHYIPFFGLYKI